LVRATRDMGFFVAPDPENVECLRRALRRVFGADPNLDQITSEDLAGDYPAIEYVPPQGSYSLDILSRLGEVFDYSQLEAEEMIVDGIRIRVATPRMLFRMKRGTVRPGPRGCAGRARDLAHRLSGFSFRPGLSRFHSVDEAHAHRLAWETSESRRLRGPRLPLPRETPTRGEQGK
jgi:hypothetical protein